jgi:hypothetical protein
MSNIERGTGQGSTARTDRDSRAEGSLAQPSAGVDFRRDRIRWGAVWTGALTTLTTNAVLQLLFYALGWLDLGSGSSTTAYVVSGVLGLIAFFLGGAAAGASTLWHRASDGMVNGVVSWALTVTLLLVLGLAGAGVLLGLFAHVLGGFGSVGGPPTANVPRASAGWAVLGLGLSVIASAVGGSIGSKLWPPGRGDRQAAPR